MTRVLIKVRDKEVALNLKRYGDVESVAPFLNIYAMSLESSVVDLVSSLDGVVKVEHDEHFEVQM